MAIIAALGALIVIYIIIMMIIKTGKADTFDLHWMHRLHFHADKSEKTQKPKIRRLMLDTTALGGDTFLVIFSFMIIGISATIENWYLLHSYLTVALHARVLGYILKKIVNRKRPALLANAPQMFTTSFPSVHTMMATALYLWLGFIMPQAMDLSPNIILQLFCVALIMTIGFSRLYLAVHWPSDVLAGLIAGLIIILTVQAVFYA